VNAVEGHQEVKAAARDHEDHEDDNSEVAGEFVVEGVSNPQEQQVLIFAGEGDGLLLDDILAAWADLNVLVVLDFLAQAGGPAVVFGFL
jgi:hypothetical protein